MSPPLLCCLSIYTTYPLSVNAFNVLYTWISISFLFSPSIIAFLHVHVHCSWSVTQECFETPHNIAAKVLPNCIQTQQEQTSSVYASHDQFYAQCPNFRQLCTHFCSINYRTVIIWEIIPATEDENPIPLPLCCCHIFCHCFVLVYTHSLLVTQTSLKCSQFVCLPTL